MKRRRSIYLVGAPALVQMMAFVITILYFTSCGQTAPTAAMPSKTELVRVVAQISVPQKLLPVDEAAQDLSFLEFRTALRQAICRRDAKFLIGVLDKN